MDEHEIMTLRAQTNVFNNRAEEEFDLMLEDMRVRKAEIIETAFDRFLDGFYEYGDRMWRWDDDKRDKEMMEEWADGLNYRISRNGSWE